VILAFANLSPKGRILLPAPPSLSPAPAPTPNWSTREPLKNVPRGQVRPKKFPATLNPFTSNVASVSHLLTDPRDSTPSRLLSPPLSQLATQSFIFLASTCERAINSFRLLISHNRYLARSQQPCPSISVNFASFNLKTSFPLEQIFFTSSTLPFSTSYPSLLQIKFFSRIFSRTLKLPSPNFPPFP
jgi:hypothetical protein